MGDDTLLRYIAAGMAEAGAGGVHHRNVHSFADLFYESLNRSFESPAAMEPSDDGAGALFCFLTNESVDQQPDVLESPAAVPSDTPSTHLLRRPAGAASAPARVPKRPPPWYVGMSSAFSAAIRQIDRKLQGRILEAIAEITQEPMKSRGDTVKPLTGELRGCWRYRLGDYRMVYSPDLSSGNITLLAFASRGSAYAD